MHSIFSTITITILSYTDNILKVLETRYMKLI